jgi:hypothetical protein
MKGTCGRSGVLCCMLHDGGIPTRTTGLSCLLRQDFTRFSLPGARLFSRYGSHDGRNVTVIAFFGSTSTLSLRPRVRNAGDPPTLNLSLTNNAVVAIGSGALHDGWEYGVQPVRSSTVVGGSSGNVPGHIPTTTRDSAIPELFTVVVRGKSTAFVDRTPPLAFAPPPSSSFDAPLRSSSRWAAATGPAAEVSSYGSASDDGSSEIAGERRRGRGRSRKCGGNGVSGSRCHSSSFRSASTRDHADDSRKRQRSRY